MDLLEDIEIVGSSNRFRINNITNYDRIIWYVEEGETKSNQYIDSTLFSVNFIEEEDTKYDADRDVYFFDVVKDCVYGDFSGGMRSFMTNEFGWAPIGAKKITKFIKLDFCNVEYNSNDEMDVFIRLRLKDDVNGLRLKVYGERNMGG